MVENAWGQSPEAAKRTRTFLREQKKMNRLHKLFRKRGYGLP